MRPYASLSVLMGPYMSLGVYMGLYVRAAWLSDTERCILHIQCCDSSLITVAGRLPQHIRGLLKT